MASPNPSNYTSKLHDARVLVIGGTSGIGFGIAEALLEHNASVIISSSSEERVSNAVQRLKSTNPAGEGRIQGIVCNLASPTTVEAEVRNLFSQISPGGKLDHIIYTAGDTLAIGKFENFSLQQIQQAGMVRFFGPLIVAQQLREHLREGPASSFIMTTGGLSQRPRRDWTVIMSYLTGLEGMCRGLARDLAPRRVNLVGPGPVETELWGSHRETGDLEELKASIAGTMATGKFGEVEDVVEAYLYLMKDQNTTGSMVYTNGGGLLI
ncbi:MAG: hypothetical protein OHK93_003888 [Ramalina farinacea]|uniref:Uncharacterized protein n=1 Tax=Ramalina farinacea TaxID=258253 RepID=A0AA43TS76_9LECA|nr:hypothetical protein [Ramalina farinacea]